MQGSDLELLVSAAKRAGEIATPLFDTDTERWDKPDGAGPVTEADLAVDAHLRTTLTQARPEYGWLSEETPDSTERLTKRMVFIVDPIDGTRSFVEGSRTWAHSLAVVRDGIVTAAAVYLPLRELMYTAERGKGAWLNGARLKVSVGAALNNAEILATRPNMDPKFWRDGQVPGAKRHHRPSLAYRLCLIAQGRFDAMLTLRPSWEWDIAAGCLIAQEAGATVSDVLGQALRFNSVEAQTRGVITAADALHETLCAQLAPLDPASPLSTLRPIT